MRSLQQLCIAELVHDYFSDGHIDLVTFLSWTGSVFTHASSLLNQEWENITRVNSSVWSVQRLPLYFGHWLIDTEKKTLSYEQFVNE